MSTMGFLDTEWPQEGLWHMEVEPTGLPFMGCALSWVLRDAAHTADSPHRLSMKCTLQRKNSKKKIPQDSKVVLFSGKKKKIQIPKRYSNMNLLPLGSRVRVGGGRGTVGCRGR